MTERLTTIDHVREWAGSKTSDDDKMLTRMIDQASRLALSYLQRESLLRTTYTDYFDGKGVRHTRQYLRHWPIISADDVASVYDGDTLIPAAPAVTSGSYVSGWNLSPWNGLPPGSPQSIDLKGYSFCQGRGNVVITYTAGYAVLKQANTIPAAPAEPKIQVSATGGIFGADVGVYYATSGTALTPVSGSAAPTAGQYSVNYKGIYTFNSSDAGTALLISFSYVPYDVDMAVAEWIAERYAYKQRIGTKSKALGGQETVSYDITNIPTFVQLALQPYKQVMLL